MDVTFDAEWRHRPAGLSGRDRRRQAGDQAGIAEAELKRRKPPSHAATAGTTPWRNGNCRLAAGETMSNLLDLLVAGLATGAIYALVAVGFTLLWQTSQTINFAQGEFVMLPAFLMLAVMHAGAPFWLAILIGILLSMLLLGLALQAAAGRSDAAPWRTAAGDRDHGAGDRYQGSGEAVLQRRSLAIPLDHARRRYLDPRTLGLAAKRRRAGVGGHRRRRAHRAAEPHLARSSDAGGGAESDRGAHHRRSRRAHDPADLPDQRRPGGAGLAA